MNNDKSLDGSTSSSLNMNNNGNIYNPNSTINEMVSNNVNISSSYIPTSMNNYSKNLSDLTSSNKFSGVYKTTEEEMIDLENKNKDNNKIIHSYFKNNEFDSDLEDENKDKDKVFKLEKKTGKK